MFSFVTFSNVFQTLLNFVCHPWAFAFTALLVAHQKPGTFRAAVFTMMSLRAMPGMAVGTFKASHVGCRVPISSVVTCHSRAISCKSQSRVTPRGRDATQLRASRDDPTETNPPNFDPLWSEPGYRGAVVSAMPQPAQAGSVLAVWGGLAFVTWVTCGAIGPFIQNAFPSYFEWSRGLWPVLGITYIAAGAAHFGIPKGFEDMFPHKGAWGFWYLPGSPDFHVKWTGVAEILGGVGMASALVFGDTPVSESASLGMFYLTVAVTPANTYMWSHNSPGPLPENADESMLTLPKEGHTARAVLQVMLLAVTWGMAHPP